MAEAEVVAQKNKLVGDEAVRGAAQDGASVDVNTESVKAQVAPEREKAASTVPVHETVVQVDEVITDPNDARAVQVPDAGRGDASTPIARAYANGARTVEDVFASEASQPDEPAPEEQ